MRNLLSLPGPASLRGLAGEALADAAAAAALLSREGWRQQARRVEGAGAEAWVALTWSARQLETGD
jgi:hypothetical protein